MSASTHPFLDRLQHATNAHQPDALVDCFAPTYVNATPCHPGRGFRGREQVRANWRQIFAFVPDVRSTVLRWAEADGELWSEWQMSGTRLDGTRHLMGGVIVFRVRDGRAIRARFYLEPVDEDRTTDVDDAVRHQVRATGTPT